ncbi:hypothetical protein Tco_0491206 [Tanacetum coccineum]
MTEPLVEKPEATKVNSSLTLSSSEFTSQFLNDIPDVTANEVLKDPVEPEVQSMVDVPDLEVAVEFVVATSLDCFDYFDLRLRSSIMGEPLSPDRVFDFPMDEPLPAYDFFVPGPLPGYAGNPNNTNGCIEADVPLLGEMGEVVEPLGAEVDELMVDPVIDELAEPIVEVEEQMVAPTKDMVEDLEVLFGDDDDSSDDDSEGPEDDEEVWEEGGPSTAAAEGHSLTLLAPGVPMPPSVIEDLCTRIGNLEHGHGLLVKKVITVSDAEVADRISIRDIGPRVSTVEGQMQVLASQMVQVVSGLEQGQQAATQRDETIARLSQQCILGFDRCLADVEKIPLGPYLSDIQVGSGSRHLEIIMIGCTGLGIGDYVVALE